MQVALSLHAHTAVHEFAGATATDIRTAQPSVVVDVCGLHDLCSSQLGPCMQCCSAAVWVQVTSKIRVGGLAAVSTAAPTASDSPFIIT
jgi:hypothetical protein